MDDATVNTFLMTLSTMDPGPEDDGRTVPDVVRDAVTRAYGAAVAGRVVRMARPGGGSIYRLR